jgi:hypothetical protein
MTMKKRSLLAVVAGLAMGASATASAITIVGGCSTSDVTNGGFAADSCQGLFTGSGGDQNYDLDAIIDYFGGGYTQLGKSDDGFGNVTAGAGTWSATGLGGYTDFVVALKQATYWAGYSFNSVHGTTGTWSTAGWAIGQPAGGLSHLGVYARGTSQVPEPGTLALLGMGLLGMAASMRRKARA